MTLDPATIDLFTAIGEALDGIADMRVIAVCSTVDRVLDGTDDPGAAADWLRGFLAQREGAEAVKARMWPMGMSALERCEAAGPHTYKDCPNFRPREASDART